MLFTVVSKNKNKDLGLTKNGPDYERCHDRMNIFGQCLNKKCKVYKKESISSFVKTKIDLINERDEVVCPL